MSVEAKPAHVRESLNPFGSASWRDYFEEITYGYMQREDNDWTPTAVHHDRWFADFDTGDDQIILAHRGALKTTTALSYVIACLEYRPGFHVAWIGNNETLAYEKAHSEFNKLTKRNPWLTTVQEGARTTDQKGKKEFQNDSSLSVGWLYGGVEGRHVDLLIVDDLIKEKGDGDMEEIENWLSSVIVPVQNHGGQTIIIGTRKTPTDIYHLLSEREGFTFTEYPALLDEWDDEFMPDAEARRPDTSLYHRAEHPLRDSKCRILWEERSTDYLKTARSKQSEHAFMREFCLVVQTREGAVYSNFDRQTHTVSDVPDTRRVYYGLDWGSNNPAAFIVFAEPYSGPTVIAETRKFPADGTQDYVDTLNELQEEWQVGTVYCDPSDKRGIDDLKKAGIDAVAAPNDVSAGIRAVKDMLNAGELVIENRCADLLEEVTQYHYNQTTGKPVKKNDHLVDAWRYGVTGDKYSESTGRGTGTW